MRARLRKLRCERGMTLVELMLAMTLMGVLVMAMTGLMTTVGHWGDKVQEDSTLQAEARASLDHLAQDLRQAYSGDATPAIESMSATGITFLSPDRSTPYRLRRISYRLNGGSLDRAQALSTNAGAPPWTFPALGPYAPQVGSVVNSAVFTYQTATGAVATSPGAVVRVNVTLVVASGRQNATNQFQISTTLRQSS
jgi:prepilin-type N-terminal cleavage/methylation domain-containing protein